MAAAAESPDKFWKNSNGISNPLHWSQPLKQLYEEQIFLDLEMHILLSLYLVNYIYTVDWVECRYKVVQYNMILRTSLQWWRQSINLSLNPQKHCIPHPNGWAMGCILWEFGRCWQCYNDRVIMAPHCIWRDSLYIETRPSGRCPRSVVVQW